MSVRLRRATHAAQSRLRHMSKSRILPYHPPEWAARIDGSNGLYQIDIGHETPIQPWFLPDDLLSDDFSISIKRDDMLFGGASAGNKYRKLSFVFAKALMDNCDTVISCGGVQSNHARITASMARELGLDPLMLLRSPTPEDGQLAGTRGNMFLHHTLGSRVFLTGQEPYETGLKPKMEEIVRRLAVDEGRKTHLIGVGGSDATGLWGYIDAWREMEEQGVSQNFDDVVVAVGSGGTAAGLAIGAWLAGSPVRVHAVAVCDDAAYFHDHTDRMLSELGLLRDEASDTAAAQPSLTTSRDILDVVDGYKGRGYGRASQEDYAFLQRVAETTGVLLDQTYTGKAVQGMLSEMRRQSAAGQGRFKGRRVLYVHTGGMLGLMDGRADAHFNRGLVQPFGPKGEGIGSLVGRRPVSGDS